MTHHTSLRQKACLQIISKNEWTKCIGFVKNIFSTNCDVLPFFIDVANCDHMMVDENNLKEKMMR
jgi:hypothetical protein